MPKITFVTNDTEAAILPFEEAKMTSEGGKWTSRHGWAESEEEIRKKCGIPDEPCRECGRLFTTNYSEPSKRQMLAAHVCFSCNHWLGFVGNRKGIRVHGRHYMDGGNTTGENKQWNGFGGDIFKVCMADGKKFQTNNMWHQGTIPEHFKYRLPDNATFEK